MTFIKREIFNKFCDVLDLKPKFLDKLDIMHEESEYPEHVFTGTLWARFDKTQEIARIEYLSAKSLHVNNPLTINLFKGIPVEDITIKLYHTIAYKDLAIVYDTLDSIQSNMFNTSVDLLIPVIAYGIPQAILIKDAMLMEYSDFTIDSKEERIPFYTEYRIQSTGKVTVENDLDKDVESLFSILCC